MPIDTKANEVDETADKTIKHLSSFTTLYRLRQKVGRDEAFGLNGVIPPTRQEVGDVKRTVDAIRKVLREFPGLAEEVQGYRDEQRQKEQSEIDARRRNQFRS
jgi:hypothetical protein